ncbi:1-phosphofructokinase family hexose kinase [Candidatus Atribacteria bacterium MT.SAG.1]|nr:1-phosphofructokinase family hexose kinase [Candidatus Atribacteria bacterium MT.SAG.1]
MIATVTLNPAIDVILEVSNLKINHYNKVLVAHTTSGGKGINVSKAVRGCGKETIAIGFLGGGRGRMIEEELRGLGITTNFWHIEEKTRSNTIISDKETGQHTLLSETGPKITEYDLEMLKSIFYRVMSQCTVVTLSGSLPRGVPVNIYGDLISIAKEREVKTILNTSGEQFIKGLEKKPFLAKPDLRESNRVFGIEIDNEKDAINAAKEVVQRGAEIGVVSLQNEKDIIATQDEIWFAESTYHKIVNIIGAGDALVAGFAVALSEEGKNLKEAIEFSMACALASALREEEEFNSREEVEKCLRCVSVKKI